MLISVLNKKKANTCNFWGVKKVKNMLECQILQNPFCQKPFEIQTKMSRSWMVQFLNVARAKAPPPFENRNIWNPTFKKSRFQMFPNFKWSDFRSHCSGMLSGIWMVQYLKFWMSSKFGLFLTPTSPSFTLLCPVRTCAAKCTNRLPLPNSVT